MRRARPTVLDRAAAFISPAWGMRRLANRNAFAAMSGQSGYESGRRNRRSLRTWFAREQTADAAILPGLPDMRARSLDAGRNQPVAGAAFERAEIGIVGPGLMPEPQIDADFLGLTPAQAEAWQEDARREFEQHAASRDIDASEIGNFVELQELALRSTLESGDVFVVHRRVDRDAQRVFSLALQFYEAQQVSNPSFIRDGARLDNGNRVVGGVELAQRGQPVAVYIQEVSPGNVQGEHVNKWARVPLRSPDTARRQVFHLYMRKRPGHTRGVPWLAPVIEELKLLSDMTEAELWAAVISGMITVVYKTPTGEPLPGLEDDTGKEAPAEDVEPRFEPGGIFGIQHGDDVQVPTPGRPNSAFEPFFQAIVQQIGARTNIPAEVLLGHFSSSYSAAKGALELAWQFFRRQRRWLVDAFCQPTYDEIITEAVVLGRLAAPGFLDDPYVRRAYLGCAWNGPVHISIDPLRENRADEIAERRSWVTGQEMTAKRTGRNFRRNVETRGREQELARDRGVAADAPVEAADEGQTADNVERGA